MTCVAVSRAKVPLMMFCSAHRGRQVAILFGAGGFALALAACDSGETAAVDARSIVRAIDQSNPSTDEYCGDPDQMSEVMAREARSPSGDYLVRIVDFSEPVASNQIFSLRIEVQVPDGADSSGISVRADAAMPHHGHGMTVRPVTRADESMPGLFAVSGMMFHMLGEWELYIDITEGPYTERVIFNAVAK